MWLPLQSITMIFITPTLEQDRLWISINESLIILVNFLNKLTVIHNQTCFCYVLVFCICSSFLIYLGCGSYGSVIVFHSFVWFPYLQPKWSILYKVAYQAISFKCLNLAKEKKKSQPNNIFLPIPPCISCRPKNKWTNTPTILIGALLGFFSSRHYNQLTHCSTSNRV